MEGLALVVGAGGIGKQIAEDLASKENNLEVILCGRKNVFKNFWELDIENENSLKDFKEKLSKSKLNLRLVFNATGRLHSEKLNPEKRLQHINRENLIESFSINAFAPILLAKTIEEFINKELDFNFASISARVGSITDNKTGGWYAYRAAKSAQNQLFKSLSIEWARKYPKAIITLLHPGTVNTNLSKPFHKFVPKDKLFSPQKTSSHLIDILRHQKATDSGKFIAWDGKEIPW